MSTPRGALAPQLLQKLRSNKQPLSCTNLVGENVRKSRTPGEPPPLDGEHDVADQLRDR